MAAKQPRRILPNSGNFFMADEHRVKIQNSNILKCLINHVEGKLEMSATQVSAGLGLLKKILPDLAASADTGKDGKLVTMKGMSDSELETIASGSSNRTSKTQESPNVLN